MGFIKDKPIFGWTMYDWANSAFATTVMAGFFPVFFKSYWSAGADVNQSTAFLGMANSIASLVVALMSPILGAIADRSDGKKRFLIFFAYLGVIMTGCLFMVNYGQWKLAAFLYIIAIIGFSGGNSFYDSLITDVTSEKNVDYVSAKGFALGYLGGGLLFLVNVLWYLMPATFGLPVEHSAVIESIDPDQAIVILAEDQDFGIPEDFEFGKADITSTLTLPARIIRKVEKDEGTLSFVKAKLPPNTDWESFDKEVSFGDTRTADLVEYDKVKQFFWIKNMPSGIDAVEQLVLTQHIPIRYTGYEDKTLIGVQGLENCIGEMNVKTDFLPPSKEFLSIRLSFLSVALWWGLFTIPLIRYIKTRDKKEKSSPLAYVKLGFSQLAVTFNKVRHLKVIFAFLIAYWLYIDGVDTIIRMAIDYGMSIGMPASSLIVALLITQFVGFPSALVFGKLGEKWDVKKAIYVTLVVYLGVNAWAVFMSNVMEFYAMAIIIGLVQGGVQALSRSFYSRLIPKNQSAEFYGFYNMLGKFAAIAGPMIIAVVNLIGRKIGLDPEFTSRAGIASLSILFISGGIALYFVDIEKGRKEAQLLEEATL